MRHLQMFLEMRSGGKPSHALGSAGQTSHAPWHGLCGSLKQQNYISDSFSVFILLRSNKKCKYIHDTNKINQTCVHTNSFPFNCFMKFI